LCISLKYFGVKIFLCKLKFAWYTGVEKHVSRWLESVKIRIYDMFWWAGLQQPLLHRSKKSFDKFFTARAGHKSVKFYAQICWVKFSGRANFFLLILAASDFTSSPLIL
jgi:hypothetical protein